MIEISGAVKYLDSTANHFVHRDWDYTRVTHIKHIRYDLHYDEMQTIKHRLTDAWHWLTRGKKWGMIHDNTLIERMHLARFALQRDRHGPDGSLDNGNVITHWEETGEYLQMVQPSVGALLANFLKEEPEHPHAVLITKELERILEGYSKRVKTGEVNTVC